MNKSDLHPKPVYAPSGIPARRGKLCHIPGIAGYVTVGALALCRVTALTMMYIDHCYS